MKLYVETIKHSSQRYDTCGDFFTDEKGVEQFRISRLPKEEYEWLILIHEIVERFLCKMDGVKNQDIDTFDMRFEKEREDGAHGDDEPGDALSAPYGQQHCMATAVERMLCGYLGIPWKEYDEAVLSLDYRKEWEKNLPSVD